MKNEKLEFKTGLEISGDVHDVKLCPFCGRPMNTRNDAEVYFCDLL